MADTGEWNRPLITPAFNADPSDKSSDDCNSSHSSRSRGSGSSSSSSSNRDRGPSPSNGLSNDSDCDRDSDEDTETDVLALPVLLKPRAYKTFWKKILAGVNIRRRPETKYCKSCRELPVFEDERRRILRAMKQREYSEWGDVHRAEARLKELDSKLPALRQHLNWYETQREAVSDNYILHVVNV